MACSRASSSTPESAGRLFGNHPHLPSFRHFFLVHRVRTTDRPSPDPRNLQLDQHPRHHRKEGPRLEGINQTPTMQCRALTRRTGHPMEHPARPQETTSIRPASSRHGKDPISTTSPQSTIEPSPLPPLLASSPCQGLTDGCSKAAPLGHVRAETQLPSRTRMTSRTAQSSSRNTTGSQERYGFSPVVPKD